jgi:hypothetical protein
MNKAALLGIAAAVALGGCNRDTRNPQAANAPRASETAGMPVMLVGCLVPGGAGSQTGAVGTSGDAAQAAFTLIDVTTTSNAPSDTGATPGASGTSGTEATPRAPTPGSGGSVDTGTPRAYSLVDEQNPDDLQKYQHSKVEVTGVIVGSTDTGAGVPDVGAAQARAGTPATNVERVRVNKVRQLDKNCNGTSQKR